MCPKLCPNLAQFCRAPQVRSTREASMSRPRQKGGFPRPTGFESVASTLRRTHGDLIVSERKLKQADEIQIVRVNRDAGTQNVGFVARPFVLCGLPVRRPTPGEL